MDTKVLPVKDLRAFTSAVLKTEGTGCGPKMTGHCGERRFGVDACQGIDSGTSGRTTVIPAGSPGAGCGVPGRTRRLVMTVRG